MASRPRLIMQSEEVKRLKSDLWFARHTVLELIPESLRSGLTSYYHCSSVGETYGWWHAVVEKIIGLAQPLPTNLTFGSERALCPLCGGGAQRLTRKASRCRRGLSVIWKVQGTLHFVR